MHTDARLLPRNTAGMGELELPPAGARDRPGDTHLPSEPTSGHRVEDAGARDLEPRRGHRPVSGARPHGLRPSRPRPGGGCRPEASQRRSTALGAPGSAVPTGATGSTRTASPAPSRPAAHSGRRCDGRRCSLRTRSAPGTRPALRSAIYEGSADPPPFRPRVRARVHLPGGNAPRVAGRDRLGHSAAPPLFGRRPAPVRFRRADFFGDKQRARSTRRCRALSKNGSGSRPAGPVAHVGEPAHLGMAVQPDQPCTSAHRARAERRGPRGRGREHALARASRLCRRPPGPPPICQSYARVTLHADGRRLRAALHDTWGAPRRAPRRACAAPNGSWA